MLCRNLYFAWAHLPCGKQARARNLRTLRGVLDSSHAGCRASYKYKSVALGIHLEVEFGLWATLKLAEGIRVQPILLRLHFPSQT
jgi:hypothetical protein